MRLFTLLSLSLTLFVGSSFGQSNEFNFDVPVTDEFTAPYSVGIHSGARALYGPVDLDGDGLIEVLVSDYSGGGRIHVIENVSADTWEHVYSTPWLDSTATTLNNRAVGAGDLDGDGRGEFYFFGGTGYSATNPNIDALPFGLYGWEHTGADNDYGQLPATVFTFPDDVPDRWNQERIIIQDVDGDGIQELMFGNNGANNRHDNWYILSVSGDIGSQFEVWNVEARISSRASDDFDPVDRGGGSPYAIHPADLNGDGIMDFSMHSWNNFNLTNGTVVGPDEYHFPDSTATNVFYRAYPADHVSLFGGVVVDIDNNGDDEVFYPRFQGGDVVLVNYEEGEDILEITADNVVPGIITGLTTLGIAAVDLDQDGRMELIGSGPSYTAAQADAGNPPIYLRIVEYNGGDVEDPASYSSPPQEVLIGEPFDEDGFHVIVRDSLGFTREYRETGQQGPVFVSKIVGLGDADGDGVVEVAVAFQGVDDRLNVISEVWNPDSLVGGFDTPDGGVDPAPIGPGESYSFSFDAAPGSNFSFATMFVESNDLFYAPADTGIALWDSEGNMRSGDLTGEIMLWDAGTELNEEPFVGPNQAPRQDSLNTGLADTLGGVTPCCVDGYEYPAVADVINVTLDADEGTGVFTVTISNVSVPGAAGKSSAAAVPLAPGVFAIGPAVSELFAEGSPAGAALERLAEDGDNSILLASLRSEFETFRTIVETVDNPVRSFLRIFSWDGVSVQVQDDRIILPSDYKLSQNYPNPFNPSTNFDFTLPIDKKVSVKIYDVMGRLVTTLVNDELLNAGTHRVTWNGSDVNGKTVASGQYVYTLEYGNFRQSRTMILVK